MNKKRMTGFSKRGQLTIFIIIGIVLLLSAGLVIYFTTERAKAPVKRAVTVPEDVQQVYDYVTTCVDQITKDGLIIMGAQGGYIDIPPVIDRSHNAYVPNDPAGVSKTPFWYYEGEDRTPDLDFMTRALAVYIKEELPTCADFGGFEDQFDIVASDTILPIVTLTDEDVIVEVKWPLDISVNDKQVSLDEFVSEFPVKLREMWTVADTIMKTENKEEWFENMTMGLLVANQDIPTSGMEFRCGTRRWNVPEVISTAQNMLYYNIPFIRVENTNYPPPLESLRVYTNLKQQAQNIRDDLADEKEPDWPENPPADVYQMNKLRFDAGLPQATELKVGFQYLPNWPLLMNPQPSSGGTMSTARMKGSSQYLRFLCINQWHFAYDVIYPIKVTIKDENAFNGEGYSFSMAFPVIIKDNEGSRAYFGLRQFQIPDSGKEFCTLSGDQDVDVRATGFVEGSPVAEELDGVNITYRCLNKECILGNTYSDGSGAIRLYGYLPASCTNPLLIGEKEGYLPGSAHATGNTVDLHLTKLEKLKYKIAVYPRIPGNPATWLPSYEDFARNEHATVSLSIREPSHDQYKTYPASAESLRGDYTAPYGLSDVGNVTQDDVEFIYGDAQYDIDILLFKDDTLIGGYHAENMTIPYEQIAGAEEVTFNVVEWRGALDEGFDPTNMFLFLYEGGLYQDGRAYQTALRPTFR